jgi:hypothetical protein
LDLAADQVGRRRPGAFIRHVDEIDARHALEQLGGEVDGRADAR